MEPDLLNLRHHSWFPSGVDPVSSSREKAQELSTLKQGKNSVCDYAIHFRMLAAESGWNNTALYDIFLKGLSPDIQDLLTPLDLPLSLDALITLAIRTDNQRNDTSSRNREYGKEQPSPRTPCTTTNPCSWAEPA